jgi:hypothetical protein
LAGVGEQAGLDDFVVEAQNESFSFFVPKFLEQVA